jgi:hypothetical protein
VLENLVGRGLLLLRMRCCRCMFIKAVKGNNMYGF